MFSKKLIMRWIIGLLAISLLIVSCAPAPEAPDTVIEETEEVVAPADDDVDAEPEPEPETSEEIDTVRLLYWQAISILNPHLALGLKDQDGSRIFYEPLMSFGVDGSMTPLLAEEVPSFENGLLAEDGTSVTYKLRQGVTWHDGEPFTADDVIFTYEYVTNPEVGAITGAYYGVIDSIDKVDDFTVTINFKNPNPAWYLPFSGVEGSIIPKHIFEPYAGENSREAPANLMPVGTGAFKIVDFRPDEILVAEAFENYWEAGLPYFDRVEIVGGGDAVSGARAVLQTGEADYSYAPMFEPALMDEMEAFGLGEVMTFASNFAERIQLNYTDPNTATEDGEFSSVEIPHPFLTDPLVRKAIAYAIDRETIVDQLYGKVCILTDKAIQAPPQFVSDTVFPHIATFDLDMAASLLDEAGWLPGDDGVREKDGVRMSIIFQTSISAVRQKTQEIIKQDLESIGFEVELKSVDASIFFGGDPANPDSLQHFSADLQEYNNGSTTFDPAPYMSFYITDEITQQANNYSGRNIIRFSNEEYDALYEQQAMTFDMDERALLFHEMDDILMENIAFVPICMKPKAAAVSYTLANVELSPWDADLASIRNWQRVEAP